MIKIKRTLSLLCALFILAMTPAFAASETGSETDYLNDDASNSAEVAEGISKKAADISALAQSISKYYTSHSDGLTEDQQKKIVDQSDSIAKQSETVSKKADALKNIINGEATTSRKPLETTEGNLEKQEESKNPFVKFWNNVKKNFKKTFIDEDRYAFFLQGFKTTIIIAIFATLIGVTIGMFVAIFKVYGATNKNIIVKAITKILNLYVTVIRGTPMAVQLLISYYIIFASSKNDILVAIFAFGINSGAYVSEIIRAGILAVDKGQTEAGRSLGLTYFSTMKSIVMPQAFKNILPALGNEFITILKETSIAGYIAVTDLTKAGAMVRSRTFEPYFSLLSVALVYLILVVGMSAIFKSIERRLAKSDRN